MADTPALLLEGVRKSFGTGVVTEVLRGVDLRVERGEFAALMGPSGSGKSTLLNILGLLDRPTHGRVVLAGHDTTHLDDAARTKLRGQALGFVFQFHHLLPGLTAVENVMMPLATIRGWMGADLRPRALALLDRVGLAEKADVLPKTMSGGQQQRVAIARALIAQPPLVLADEPTGNLDTQTSDQTFEVLREFNRTFGVAFLIVTHDPRLAARCDRSIELLDGRVVGDHRAAE